VGALGVELMMLIHTRLPRAAAARQRDQVLSYLTGSIESMVLESQLHHKIVHYYE